MIYEASLARHQIYDTDEQKKNISPSQLQAWNMGRISFNDYN